MAGLNRLGLRAKYTVPFDVDTMIPAVAQGALAVECRAEDTALATTLHATLSDPITEIAVRAERAFLRRLQAGCQAPVGAYATYDGIMLTLRGVIAAHDGSRVLRATRSAPLSDPRSDATLAEQLGDDIAAELQARGGTEILAGHAHEPLRGTLFLLARTQERPSRIAPALRGAGATVIEASDSAQATLLLEGRIPDMLLFPSSGSAQAIATYLTELHARKERPLVAAMGNASAAAATEQGFTPDVTAAEPSIAAFVQCVTEYILTVKRVKSG